MNASFRSQRPLKHDMVDWEKDRVYKISHHVVNGEKILQPGESSNGFENHWPFPVRIKIRNGCVDRWDTLSTEFLL